MKTTFIFLPITSQYICFKLGSIAPFEGTWQCSVCNMIKGDCAGEIMLINECNCKYQLYLLQVILILLQGRERKCTVLGVLENGFTVVAKGVRGYSRWILCRGHKMSPF
ncbi:hypothetical protein CMV_002050 [Castanea mollissima]|uniref:Uncharacterized protein n=1 Tax=Castanea mollissima TaxID=60419 RepID=A0A8J4RU65_9ROSI|nr:hypothetical protein CMV_002050 [Castanea mollissima]